jgi:2OG-Fe(II) oxygenase superfamily
MHDILDLDAYPLDRPEESAYAALVEDCRADLARDGMFNLGGFLRPDAAARAAAEVMPQMAEGSYHHRRRHNIYFRREIPGLAPCHPALTQFETSNRTVCADRIPESIVVRVYEWAPLRRFLAATMGKDELHLMADPLARANVMAYGAGEALNWHFDRSEFTTTLLLQAPEAGGDFEYRTDLRSDEDPNYEGVARLLRGEDEQVRTLRLSAGTLNVFQGKNTAHRVTPVRGARDRMIAVFSYYERPGVTFSEEERIGFYGRAA